MASKDSSGQSSSCPYKGSSASTDANSSPNSSTTKTDPNSNSDSSSSSSCPYTGSSSSSSSSRFPSNSELPANQRPSPGQTKILSTERVKSTIPKSDGGTGKSEDSSDVSSKNGDDTEDVVWEYPSPQMFYNAMKRKGYAPQETDMATVVQIHNAVNEQTWRQVMRWEQRYCDTCPTPKLLKFQGRPKDLSPKVQ